MFLSFEDQRAEFGSNLVVEVGVGEEPALRGVRGVGGAEPEGEDAGDVGCHCWGCGEGSEGAVLCGDRNGKECVWLVGERWSWLMYSYVVVYM